MHLLCEIACIFNFCKVNSKTQSRYLVFFDSLSMISNIILGVVGFQADTSDQLSSIRIYRFV